ncbi:thioesterase II family protein [Catenulispora rubra]|uniref:thioesterase II family protein n=1 Tax=Catenulispora rubra TaxID=280293 RepID=UPI0018924270|nr:alpha/beta fold hydrolase [Catenulispora rubra]
MDALITTDAEPRRMPAAVDAVRWPASDPPRLRLFCLPHAGGGAVTYRLWARHLGPDVEVVSIRLPGRETRHRQAPARRIDQLVPALTRTLAAGTDLPYAVFGHSLGALLAFETCRELARLDLAQPVRLLVSGRPGPHLVPRLAPIHDASDRRLCERLREMGGTPEEVLQDQDVMSNLLRVLRADLEVAETYRCLPAPPLDIPISVFGGAGDRFVPTGDLGAWAEHSKVGCRVRVYEGSHFYLHEDPAPILRDIATDLSEFCPSPR